MAAPSLPIPHPVVREANRIVATEPAIEAVILFGSRARGDHHHESDIDLAIVSRAARNEVRGACRPLTEINDTVQVVSVNPTELQIYRNTGNRIEREIVLDGKPVAGNWTRPRHRRTATNMDHGAFVTAMGWFATRNMTAMLDLIMARHDCERGCNRAAFNTLRATGAAATGLLALYGLTPRKNQGVQQLANQLRNTGRRLINRRECEALAEQLDELNARAIDAKEADNCEHPIETLATTERRLAVGIQLAGYCIEIHARQATALSRTTAGPDGAHAEAVRRTSVIFHGPAHCLSDEHCRHDWSAETTAAIEHARARTAPRDQGLRYPHPGQHRDPRGTSPRRRRRGENDRRPATHNRDGPRARRDENNPDRR